MLVGDRGSVSAELVLAVPVLLLLLLLIVQFALWSHASHIAQAAAAQGLAVLRSEDGTEASGTARAQQLLDQLADGPLTAARVTSERGPETATVQISGTATAVVPFLSLPVAAEATGPVERFVPQSGGFANSEVVADGN